MNSLDRILSIIRKPDVQAGLSMSAAAVGIGNPIAAAIVTAFKDIAAIADEMKCQYIINGLASGLNQEKFINELESYVTENDSNASFVANTLRKALLADSPIVCTLMGRILADHVADKKTYDQCDMIIIHALGTAMDEDLITFRKMVKTISDNKIAVRPEFMDCADWCVNNRLCKEDRINYIHDLNSNEYFNAIVPGEPTEKLQKYLDEIRGLFRWID